MCSVIGGFMNTYDDRLWSDLAVLYHRSSGRGRDDQSYLALQESTWYRYPRPVVPPFGTTTFVGNLRGEPTTEWVAEKQPKDQQPFISPSGTWAFTHNGTIANDKQILEVAGVTPPTLIDSYSIGVALDRYGWPHALDSLVGSYALLAVHREVPDIIHWAANYKPLFMLGHHDRQRLWFASQKSYFEGMYNPVTEPGPVEMGPYRYGTVHRTGDILESRTLYSTKRLTNPRVLVVCSGGLDSGTVAWWHKAQGHDVDLLHLQYGCRAEAQEVRATNLLAEALGSKVVHLQTDIFETVLSSVLTDPTLSVNHSRGGQAGAEFAHEWVPARNTIMLAMALGLAERHDYDVIALGSNMEEGGAYPDNEMEFVNKFRELSPYAVKPGHRVEFSDPCGGLVKHEIVELGAGIGMPFELTWSCYETGDIHCGTCGPCSMRRTAFRMAGVTDPTTYRGEAA
jgi:7-cyano-7-deazaguanine synthase